MKGKEIGISIAIIIALVATTYLSKQPVGASRSVATLHFISTNNKSNNYGISKPISKIDYGDIDYKQSLDYNQIKVEENSKKQAQLKDLEKGIRTFLGSNINKVGLVYYDIESENFIEINQDKQFLAASTIKVPINMLMYDMIQEGKIDINEKLIFKECDYEEGAGELQGTDLSKPIALKTLSDYSIIYSDNIAINMILRKVGDENKYKYIEKILGHPTVHSENNTTPKDSFKILEKLYLNLDNNKYYSGLIETMKKTDYHDRIDKYIPKGIVAHKIGDFGECVNDIAIVSKDNPYILVIFTEELPNADETIAKVSKMIYDAQK
ncbi:class A beta-lactamase-related serine hydrolase [Clostridium tagluense]|uniref:serine hydrolase n=1 Tax=Clostridium TaxID=1485 RepID=UPI0013E92C94|nr:MULTISPECIES: serine hydrolase [Clostridium]MBU3126830.1 class A beta-lactamase-related serine hydrolase [Clostridium tagluense]MBZ9625508.1 class A beta-lactamase-related serine hydrolase [Clostridium sp. FP2]MCB2310506.1 class A beta-lactamase-related serine hydrolase [Clostridium tagluense]MCB2315328.1 class A beta-lactamase-related serine hydrolase [Clostridium tagluense]MCB2320179.1 class A beta-lactamase-related serine hydrolase [Clostridium tagluense]